MDRWKTSYRNNPNSITHSHIETPLLVPTLAQSATNFGRQDAISEGSDFNLRYVLLPQAVNQNHFGRCVAPDKEDEEIHKKIVPYDYKRPEGYLRVAVIVAGTLQRFMFNSTLHHMMKPFGDGRLDHFLSLTAAQGKAFRSDIGYTNHFQPDPILPKPNLSDFANVEEFTRAEVTARGATIGAVKIQESIDIDSEPMLQKRREQAQKDHPEEDPDLRFLQFDCTT